MAMSSGDSEYQGGLYVEWNPLHDLNDKASTVLKISCQNLNIALDMRSSAAHQQAMAKGHS